MLPRYPIYVVSKNRADRACPTPRFLDVDRVPFSLVVEPQEADAYAAAFGRDRLLVLPFSDLGLGSVPARNWVKAHATAGGWTRHWIVDDNINRVYRFFRGKRVQCASGPAFAAIEDFVDRYENVAIAGMNYCMFGLPDMPPYFLNVHVYSCMLIQNDLPYAWRGRYNEDTDLCLQALAGGYCTVLVNAFLVKKRPTGEIKGGNTTELYGGDGRLKMARSLEAAWPGVVTTKRRFGRPQHAVHDQWRKFTTPLKRRADAAIVERPNEYGLTLKQEGTIASQPLQRWVDDALKR